MLQRTQERAMEREQSARSEEEEYSTENAQLQSQDEQLTQQVKAQTAEATQSQAEVEALREQVKELRSSRAMHERSSHAAWVANERELIQARRDLQLAQALHQNLKTELSRTRTLLTDPQRRTLGLPPKAGTPAAAGTEGA